MFAKPWPPTPREASTTIQFTILSVTRYKSQRTDMSAKDKPQPRGIGKRSSFLVLVGASTDWTLLLCTSTPCENSAWEIYRERFSAPKMISFKLSDCNKQFVVTLVEYIVVVVREIIDRPFILQYHSCIFLIMSLIASWTCALLHAALNFHKVSSATSVDLICWTVFRASFQELKRLLLLSSKKDGQNVLSPTKQQSPLL